MGFVNRTRHTQRFSPQVLHMFGRLKNVLDGSFLIRDPLRCESHDNRRCTICSDQKAPKSRSRLAWRQIQRLPCVKGAGAQRLRGFSPYIITLYRQCEAQAGIDCGLYYTSESILCCQEFPCKILSRKISAIFGDCYKTQNIVVFCLTCH